MKHLREIEKWVDTIRASFTDREAGGLIGINGLDCSGKTTLAEALQKNLNADGYRVDILHVDDFNNKALQAVLYKAYEEGQFGPAEFEQYYTNSIDYTALQKALKTAKAAAMANDDLLIVEGVFLFRNELAPFLDYKILLKSDPAEGLRRYKSRKIRVGDKRPDTVFMDIWLPAYARYRLEYNIEKQADLVLGNDGF